MAEEAPEALHEFGRFSALIEVSLGGRGSEEFKHALAELLELTARGCAEAVGKFVGHVKAYARSERGSLKANLVDLRAGASVEGGLGGADRAELMVDAIAYRASDSDVRGAFLRALESALASRGFSYSIIKQGPSGGRS